MMLDRNQAEVEVGEVTDEWVGIIQKESAARIRVKTGHEHATFPYGRRASTSMFDWSTELVESFVLFASEWDVSLAKRIIREHPRTIEAFKVEEAAALLPNLPEDSARRTLDFSVHIDWDRVESGERIDLSVPVIIASVGNNRIPIDGWHRIARARFVWARELPCVILSLSETKRISMS